MTPRVLLAIATVSPDKRFLESLFSFSRDCKDIAQIDDMWVWNKPLVDAQNDFVERVIKDGYDYLLTIEDDHWAFTSAMLESCLNADTHVCAISYRSRHMPFMRLPMRYSGGFGLNGNPLYDSINETSGYHKADLISFGFTLIRSDVFRILDRPFFRLNTERFTGVGPRATDIDFSTRLLEKDIIPMACCDHVLNHRDINEESYKEMLVKGIMAKHSMFTMLRNNSEKIKKERLNAAN